MNDYFRRIDVKLIHPVVMDRFLELVYNLEQNYASQFWATSGFRTAAEQEALYSIGRTTELNRKPVTKARAWQSIHQFGLAVDFCRDADHKREGLQPDWDVSKYYLLGSEAKKLGLNPGVYWKSFQDPPHVELDLALYGLTLGMLQEAQRKGGLKAVWALVDANITSL